MILCVTLSPAIDRTGRVDRIALDTPVRPRDLVALPGGKGINVARAAHALGAPVMTTGYAGGHAGRWIVEALATEGLNPRFVATLAETRTTYVLIGPRGRSLLLYEPAAPVDSADEQQLLALLRQELLPLADIVVIAGSLPAMMQPQAVADLVDACQEAHRPCLVDVTGPALTAALAVGPEIVKISLQEGLDSGLPGLRGRRSALAVAEVIHDAGAGLAVVTDGSHGADAFVDGEGWHVDVPPVSVASAVGSGDAFSAGLAIAYADGCGVEASLASGAAAGTANAQSLGAGRLDPTAYVAVLAAVRVQRQA